MPYDLSFVESNYEIRTCTVGQEHLTYRAFEKIPYCRMPKSPVQVLNLYVPESLYEGREINGYTLHNAPIFMPNTVGGYMEGPAGSPGAEAFGQPNAVFRALQHGYVVACAGIRGRSTDLALGRAPALIVDMKAAIRYLRHNRRRIPGNTDYIITSGTSAGGALSALTGASGNRPEYQPYLDEIGAAEEPDHIFAANCYCPIHNLEHADAAYEWMFSGHNEFFQTRFQPTDHGISPIPFHGVMSRHQQRLSPELKALFPPYLNGLCLKDHSGAALALNADGTGSFLDAVKAQVLRSAREEWSTRYIQTHLPFLQVEGSQIEAQDYLTLENGKLTDLDWDGYVAKITRMKTAPAFDALDLSSPENEEFGTEQVPACHFTPFSAAHSQVGGQLADPAVVRLLNPTCFVDNPAIAPHWRIRHGAFDRDTAIAIPVILATLLENQGLDVDFSLPWGLPHCGDYDLDALFAWVDARISP